MVKKIVSDRTIETTFRVLLSLIFLVSGFKHIIDPHSIAARLSQSSWSHWLTAVMPLSTHAFLAGIVLLAGGLGVLFGSKTRLSSLALILVLLPITVTVQMDSSETLGPLFKNIAILGGLIYFAYFGTRGWSIDQIKWQRGRMSTYFSVLIVLMLALGSIALFPKSNGSSGARLATPEVIERNVAILVREPRHLVVAMETIAQGKKAEDEIKIDQGHIVVCGKPGVSALKWGSDIQNKIVAATEMGITISACGITLKEAKISQNELIESVRVVDNGLAEMIRLQTRGFISIEI